MLVDSHCHLNMLNLDKYDGDLSALVKATQESGVDYMLNVSVSLDTVDTVVKTAQQFDNIYASVGLHPSDVKGLVPQEETLLALTEHERVVAIGETGLDYHYNDSSLEEMRESFRAHVRVAKKAKLPLIVHSRAAQEDTINILREEGAAECGGVMHCFTESWEMAEQAMELGFYISISGIVTFKNAQNVQDVATKVPLERLLIETDSPYLTPVPYRGKPNEPMHVRYVAEKIAELKGLDFDEVAAATTRNFFELIKQPA